MLTKILIIEDEALVRQIYKKLLNSEEFEILLASLGYEGLEIFKNNPDIDVILLDAGLPDVDGFAILEKVQAIHPDVPIIIVSGFDLAEKIYELTKPDKVYFLKKPFTYHSLYNLIHEALEA